MDNKEVTNGKKSIVLRLGKYCFTHQRTAIT